MIAVSALVLLLYPLRAKKEAEAQQSAREMVRPADGDAISPEAMPLPEELGGFDDAPEDAVIEEMTPEQKAQIAAGAEYLDNVRRIPGASPLLDDIIDYLKSEGGDDLALSELPVDDDGMIALDDPMNERLIQNPEIRAKWERLMALIAANPPPKHQLRN